MLALQLTGNFKFPPFIILLGLFQPVRPTCHFYNHGNEVKSCDILNFSFTVGPKEELYLAENGPKNDQNQCKIRIGTKIDSKITSN